MFNLIVLPEVLDNTVPSLVTKVSPDFNLRFSAICTSYVHNSKGALISQLFRIDTINAGCYSQDMMKWLMVLLTVISVNAFAGQRTLRVAVLDTGLNLNDPRFAGVLCRSGHKDFTNTSIEDYDGHGTEVVGLIRKFAHNARYCLIIVKYWSKGVSSTRAYADALNYVYTLKPDVVNLSGGGHHPIASELLVIASNPHITFIVAAGNHNEPAEKFYPGAYGATFGNVRTIGSLDGGNRASFSNYGTFLKWRQGKNIPVMQLFGNEGVDSGTSMSTAIYTGEYLNGKAD